MNRATNYNEAVEFVYSTIPTSAQKKYPGIIGLKRMQLFLKNLGNPEKELKVIHIAGTSGKGSTSTIIEKLLLSHSFKTGLLTSPHISTIRERIKIDSENISEEDFTFHTNEILAAFQKTAEAEFGAPTYSEVLTAIALNFFAAKKIDFAVLETYLGGMFDATNAVTNTGKIAVITRLGIEHTDVLGDTIEEIAAQKVAIAYSGNTIVALVQESAEANKVISEHAQHGCKLKFVDISRLASSVKQRPEGKFIFDYTGDIPETGLQLENVRSGVRGIHQVENAVVALQTLETAATQYDFELEPAKLKQALETVRIPARFELLSYRDKTIVIDGAHNPQKMAALLNSLRQAYPNQKLPFLVSFLKGKDSTGMLKGIVDVASSIAYASFKTDDQDLNRVSQPFSEIEAVVKSLDYIEVSEATDALAYINQATATQKAPLIITGSFYFIASIYDHLKATGAEIY